MGGRGATMAGAVARHIGKVLAKNREKAQEIGKRYHKNLAAFWRGHKGKKLGGWDVLGVEREFAEGVRPDLVLVNHKAKQLFIHDPTSKVFRKHLAKGERYVKYFKESYPGYTVRYHEAYWRTLEREFKRLAKGKPVPFSGQ
ncbi:MAG: hypothetical protein AB1696_28775 [Planctomycetota bacterium]